MKLNRGDALKQPIFADNPSRRSRDMMNGRKPRERWQ